MIPLIELFNYINKIAKKPKCNAILTAYNTTFIQILSVVIIIVCFAVYRHHGLNTILQYLFN